MFTSFCQTKTFLQNSEALNRTLSFRFDWFLQQDSRTVSTVRVLLNASVCCVFFLFETVGSSFCVQLFQSIIQWTLLALFIHQWCSFSVFMYRSIMSQSISSWLSMWVNPLVFSSGFFLSGSKPEPSIQPCFPANAMLLVWCLQTFLKLTKGIDNQQCVVDPTSKSSKKMQRENLIMSLSFVYNQWFSCKDILILITHCMMWAVQIPPVLILRVFVVVQQDWQHLTCLVFSSEVVLEINTDLSCSFLFTGALTRPSLQAFHLDACDLHSLLCWLSLSYMKGITFCFALHYLVTFYNKVPLANIG